MKVEKKDLEKSQVELTVELSLEEFKPYIEKGANKVSKDVKIEGFRPGKVPFDILKQKIGEMTILEEAANIAINKTIDQVFSDHVKTQPIGQPRVEITKLAPENPLEYKVVIAVLPEITLGEYKNLNIKANKVEIKDDEVEKMIDQLRDMRVKESLVDRKTEDGDKILSDIEMFLDKVPVEGGQSKNLAIIIGKDFFVPGFSKQLIGTKKGETKEFSLPFPKDHHQKNLAGKMVEFRVKINDVYKRVLPELNDEFVQTFQAKNVEEFKTNIKKSIEQEKQQAEDQKTEIKIIDEIIKKSKIGNIPETLIQQEADGIMHEMEHNIEGQGGKFDDYLASIKKTRNDMLLEVLPEAIKRVKGALIIRALVIKEKIDVSDEEVEKRQKEMIEQYKGYQKVEDRVKDPAYKPQLKNIMINRKVIEKLKEWNIAK